RAGRAGGPGAEDDHAARAARLVPGEEREGSGGPHRARLLPAPEGEPEIPRAGRHHQPVVPDEPRARLVRHAEARPRELAERRSRTEGAPHGDAQLDLDPRLDGRLEPGIRVDDAL